MRRRPGFAIVVLALAVATSVFGAENARDFLERHWRAPLAPQGPAPAGWSDLEKSLHPEACGTCHAVQHADWRTSLHAVAMGPGVAGQLVEMLDQDPAGALACHTCHAPLAEQAPIVAAAGRFEPNPSFDPRLRQEGLPCAGCHVRGHQRFGPPRRDGSLASTAPGASLPHGGVTREPAFLRAEFCRGCHQFAPNGPALNGKLLQNTYAEWKASRFARKGVQCQDCHMPDRRHLWRGIHDPDIVRSGLAIEARGGAPRYRPGDRALVTLTVTSTGVGHAFPTYVTPRVVLRVELLDATGAPIDGSREERVIGREVALDLSHEIADTRLAPGQSVALRYRRTLDRAGLSARASVLVQPDAFYTRFFEALLAQGAGRGADQIRDALAATRRSEFAVFTRTLPLT